MNGNDQQPIKPSSVTLKSAGLGFKLDYSTLFPVF